MNERAFALLKHIERALERMGRRNLKPVQASITLTATYGGFGEFITGRISLG